VFGLPETFEGGGAGATSTGTGVAPDGGGTSRS
jgi:hypothetical protein